MAYTVYCSAMIRVYFRTKQYMTVRRYVELHPQRVPTVTAQQPTLLHTIGGTPSTLCCDVHGRQTAHLSATRNTGGFRITQGTLPWHRHVTTVSDHSPVDPTSRHALQAA